MTQYPPPLTGPGSAPIPGQPPAGTNGLAIASLVCSIAGFCVLFLGGLAGIILGLLGLRKARDPNVGGRGLAITGIVIGLLSFATSIIGTLMIVWGVHTAVRASEPPRLAAKQFVQALNAGDFATARNLSTGDISSAQLQTFISQLQPKGAFTDMTSSQINLNQANSVTTCSLSGMAQFFNGSQGYNLTLTRIGGVWKVSSALFP